MGRVSSLDMFVSSAFMPISMAVAGPVGQAVGLPVTFLIAGVAPLLIGVVALVAARMPADEIAHPLDTTGTDDIDTAREIADDRCDDRLGEPADRVLVAVAG